MGDGLFPLRLRGGEVDAVESLADLAGDRVHALGERHARLCLLLHNNRGLNSDQLPLEHPLDGGRLLQRAADELILLLIADALGLLSLLDEAFTELALLGDRLLDRANTFADGHLPLDAAFVFGFEKAHVYSWHGLPARPLLFPNMGW